MVPRSYASKSTYYKIFSKMSWKQEIVESCCQNEVFQNLALEKLRVVPIHHIHRAYMHGHLYSAFWPKDTKRFEEEETK